MNQNKELMKLIAASIESIKCQENRISVVFQDFPCELEANLLMTGDIPRPEIKKIESQIKDVHYKVVKAPHHGTPTYYWENLPKSDAIMISNGKPCSQHRKWGKIAYEYAGFYNSNKNVRLFVRIIDAKWKICSSVEHRDVAPVRELSHFGKLYCKKRRDANSAISNAIYA